MIVEHAVLRVKPGLGVEFETAFRAATSLVSGMSGFRGLTLSRCLEHADTYLLLVDWDRLEDHTEGFRRSPEYEQWRRLLHRFYEPFPVVEHFEPVQRADAGAHSR